MNLILLVFACMHFLACDHKKEFKQLPDEPVNHHLIVVAKDKQAIRAKGFLGAVKENSEVTLLTKEDSSSAIANYNGSFDISLPLKKIPSTCVLTIKYSDRSFSNDYTVKDLPVELNSMADQPFDLNKEVDSVAFHKDHASILSSSASLIRTFTLDKYWQPLANPKNILLNKEASSIIGPRALASLGDMILVSLFNKHEIELVDPKQQKITDSTKVNKAQNAEAIITIDDKNFLASFVNYYEFEDSSKNQEAVVGPGVIALMSVDNNKLTTKETKELQYKNPTHFIKQTDKSIWVVCSGAFSFKNGRVSSKDAGLVKITIKDNLITIDKSIPLNDFVPASPAIVEDTLVLPHYFSNEVTIINSSYEFKKFTIEKPGYKNFNFTFATYWYDDIVFLGESSGLLIAFSISEKAFVYPFINPIRISNDKSLTIPLNPQALHFRHQVEKRRLTDKYNLGFNAWVSSSAQAKIIPLDFLTVFGP